MSKVILHIGTHKTATTTLQDTFHRNSALLKSAGVIYPRYGKMTGHHGLAFDWSHLPDIYRLREGSRAALRQLSRDYGDSDYTVFISSEEFSRGAPDAQTNFGELRELLSGFDQIEVICTLRIQWQFLQSIYLELGKKRRVARPPELVRQCLKKGMYAGLWTAYGLMYDYLRKSFDPSEIHLVDFTTARQGPGGILGYYLRHLGTNLTPDDLELVNNGASNVSPAPLASWAANLIAEPGVAPPELVTRCKRILGANFGEDLPSSIFSEEELEKLDRWSSECNARLKARVADTQPDFALTEVPRAADTVYRSKVGGKFWIDCCHDLFKNP